MDLPEDRVEFVKDRPGHDQRYALDHGKITAELGWKPKFSLDETLKTMVEWYSKNQDWWKKIKSGEYQKYYGRQYGK